MKKHFMYRKKPGKHELMFSLCGCVMDFESDWLKPSESIEGVTCKRCLATYRRDMEDMIDDLYTSNYGMDTPRRRAIRHVEDKRNWPEQWSTLHLSRAEDHEDMKRLLSRDQKHTYTEMINEVGLSRHSTLLKRILNPLLRRLGWSIVSIMSEDTGEFQGYMLRRYPQHCPVKQSR